jgi:putative transposase
MERYKIHPDTAVYYLTFTTVHWLPIFVAEQPCQIVTDSLNYCHNHGLLRINAFVIMPTHLHLIAFDADFDWRRLRQTLMELRKFTVRQLSDFCEQKMPAIFGQMLALTPRSDRARQFWQQSRHAEAIWSRQFWQTKLAYLHDNPRRKGLVHDVTHWRYSSAAYWLLDPPGESDVCLTGIEW